jgi:hypothetical protein
MGVLEEIKKATENFVASRENFSNTNDNNNGKYTNAQVVALTVVMILWFMLIILVSRYLWNECLCKVVTVCKPTNNLYVILGVILLLDILNPSF